ncbi:MAG: DUF1624 domain-containing protein [Bacilli bacterium]|nr:DUF1624 domain-containing protein [Bacilli bacterium]
MPTRIENPKKKSRIIEIDFIRGVLIWLVAVDHLFFDFMNIAPSFFTTTDPILRQQLWALQDMGYNYWNWSLRVGFRFFCLALFFLISGISCYFSRNNLKRGLIILGVGILISVGFYVAGIIMQDGGYVFFGAITCFGVSILLYWLLRFLFEKICPKYKDDFKWIALGLGMVIIAVGLMFDCWNMEWQGPPEGLPLNWQNFIAIIIGKAHDTGPYNDYMPLFPYLGFLLVGSFIGEVFYKERKSYFKPLPTRPDQDESTGKKIAYYGGIMPYKGIKNAITFSGHYSLFFYLLHQVFLIAILGIVLLSKGYTLKL